MDYTKLFDIDGEDWHLIGDSVTNIGIQFNNQGRIRINLGSAKPDDDAPGVLIDKTALGESSTFAMSNLPLGSQVWVRAEGEDTTQITVIAY